jgi:hypothetical protein
MPGATDFHVMHQKPASDQFELFKVVYRMVKEHRFPLEHYFSVLILAPLE